MAAFHSQIAIGHVEAGLRTWNKYSPYPEEMNRQMVGCLADMHFSPTEVSAQNLLNEGKYDTSAPLDSLFYEQLKESFGDGHASERIADAIIEKFGDLLK